MCLAMYKENCMVAETPLSPPIKTSLALFIMFAKTNHLSCSVQPRVLNMIFPSSNVFLLWVEGKGILFDLDMEECISAFLHLVFCFNLRYTKVIYF